MLSAAAVLAMTRSGRWAKVGPSPVTEFQVLGERASGTNVLRRYLELNTSLESTDVLGWKHGFPHMVGIPRSCLVVCAVRAPEPWALSMHRRPWHAAPDIQALGFSDFLRAEWRSVVDKARHFATHGPALALEGDLLQMDRHPITGQAFPNLFALRTAKLAGLAGLAARECHVAFVQMEQAVADPEGFVSWITEVTGATRRGALRLPKRRLGTRFTRSGPAPKTPKSMGAGDRAFMLRSLDLAMERRFGYDTALISQAV